VREIAVHADVVCPFTHVGLRRVVAERRARGLDGRVALVVHAWPLECVNGEPLDPAFVAQEVEALRRAVAPDLFTGFDPATFPTTSIPALALTATAYERSTEVGEAAALALRDALFEHGRDIGDPDVVAEVAAGLGLPAAGDEALVWADYEAGKRLGRQTSRGHRLALFPRRRVNLLLPGAGRVSRRERVPRRVRARALRRLLRHHLRRLLIPRPCRSPARQETRLRSRSSWRRGAP